MTDLIYTRFVFIAQKKQNDMRYGTDVNKYSQLKKNAGYSNMSNSYRDIA